MNTLFITSTGTDIGKTTVLQQLLQWDQSHAQILSACKPIISGWPQDNKDIQQTDTGIILKAQGRSYTLSDVDDISPWRFTAPLSPDMAAEKEGKSIDIPTLMQFCQQKMALCAAQEKFLLIEGVGGVMVPLHQRFTVLDWIDALGCSVLLVVGSYLGTLSHTLTAVRVLEMKKIRIAGIIVNEYPTTSMHNEILNKLAFLLPNYAIFSANEINTIYSVTFEHFLHKMPTTAE